MMLIYWWPVYLTIGLAAACVMSLGIFHTFRHWGVSKKKCQGLIATFILVFLITGTVAKILSTSFLLIYPFVFSVMLVGFFYPLPLHHLHVLDGFGIWLPLAVVVLSWDAVIGRWGAEEILLVVANDFLLIFFFILLAAVISQRWYSHFGVLWFLSLFLCTPSLFLFCMIKISQTGEYNEISYFIFLIVSTLGLLWTSFKKKHPEKPLLLFDLDGTLIDSQELVFETFRQVFAQKKPEYSLSQEELYSFFGPTLEESFSRYFPKEKIGEVIDLYQQINMELHPKLLKTMPHAQEVLKELHDQGYSMGIVSNKRKEPVEYGLALSGLDIYFDQVFAKEDQPAHKPRPDGLIYAATTLGYPLDQVVYVGDNAVDIQAAHNTAFYSIGYTRDSTQREALKAEHPCELIDDLRQIPEILNDEDLEENLWIDKSIL